MRRQGHNDVPSEGPVVLLSNHESHLDPLIIGVMCPRQICAMARETLFKGVLGFFVRSYGAIPVDREGSGLGGIRATLKELKKGNPVLIFPEGTRTQTGEMGKLEPGFIALVRRSKAAIVPVGIEGAYEAMPRGASIPRPKRIGICYGESIPFEELDGLSDEDLLALVEQRMSLAHSVAAGRF